MTRRVHVSELSTAGPIRLDAAQAHHIRDVLRLKPGDAVEAFDSIGRSAKAIVDRCDANDVWLLASDLRPPQESAQIVIASAIPKGERADWMVEKLSELGISRFIPLITERSVVLPAGKNKRDRWLRIATESAKQSRRAGVMQIDEITQLCEVIGGQRAESRGQKRDGIETPVRSGNAFFLSTEPNAMPIASTISAFRPLPSALLFFIGPEGGWSDAEIALFKSAGLTGLGLTGTILRVETAAVAAAAIVACLQRPGLSSIS